MTPETLNQQRQAEQERQRALKDRILCCTVAGCLSAGAAPVREALRFEVQKQGQSDEIEVCGTGCLGLCCRGPLVRDAASGMVYAEVTPADAPALVRSDHSHFKGRLLEPDHPFYAGQRRMILANSGYADPEHIAEYIATGGYQSLLRAVTEFTPQEILAEVRRSKLRGRGGAGYPAGLKWELVARNTAPVKYVVCNADEGDPGAFMNRSVLEGDPHRVLEGMIIAGRAVGAQQGYIYARGESPLAIDRIKIAIEQARREGFLGGRIFDSNFQFQIDLRIGAGAYVCGEETALLASIEGKRGQPVPRPPYPPESGLWGRPTLINNVETFANIRTIIEKGGDWFASIGSSTSPGTKVFALAGRIQRTGLVEVPIGTTLRTILFDLGGGVPAGYEFKAAQTGGPAGGCIPAQYLDLPMDYDSLTGIGTMMGSGGLIVLDTSSCMVDLARFFMEFCSDESCGKCIPCRAGTVQLLGILTRMTRGEAEERDFPLLEELCALLKQASLCGLGLAAPNPVLSTLRHFRDEYEAHVRERRCPAGHCQIVGARGRGVRMSVRTLEIDGRMITALEGQTIFAAAWDSGIHIPRLCHLGGLSDVASCRLCLVEIEGQKRLQPSCMTTVTEDMVVRTETPSLKAHRKLIVELLLAERNHICSVCVLNGACELQDLAAQLGVDHVRLMPQYPKLGVDLSHDRFGLDHNRCILCTRCVRVCDEVEGAHTWDIAGRGRNSRVISDLGEAWGDSESCTGCGKCVQVCPTAALFLKGKTVAEMRKDRSFLRYITTAREKKLWIR